MHHTKLVSIACAIATTTSLFGCVSPADGTEAAAKIYCPNLDCVPDDPPDPPEEPPEEEPPPDWSKLRETFIPLAFVSTKLDDFLGGTKVQVSHTTGELRAFPYFQEVCQTQNTPEVLECIADCNNADFPPIQAGECRDGCRNATETCTDVCTSYNTLNWIHWGNNARTASVRADHKRCDATTCPACNPAIEVPSLEDRGLPVPIFEKGVTVGPFSYQVACRVNQWVFQVGANIAMEVTPGGLTMTLPGTNANPAVLCTNLPDVYASNLALQVKLWFPPQGLAMIAEGTLLGDWQVAGVGIDLREFVANKIRVAAHDALNTAPAVRAYIVAFHGLINEYVTNVNHERLDSLVNIQAADGGLRVRYWVQ